MSATCASAQRRRTGPDRLEIGLYYRDRYQYGLHGYQPARLEKLGCRKVCFMADADVAAAAKAQGTTRAQASMDKAAALEGAVIVAVGNAPTALLRLRELIDAGNP